ncbi:hypothetical protein ACG04Q_00995 [Roseateles sp. DXS20W]|uniref:Uncharacterized protein n=1 Tax=Pelomonas lactea TaxID=3299030 RepID=A0ABW7GE45_9BURK
MGHLFVSSGVNLTSRNAYVGRADAMSEASDEQLEELVRLAWEWAAHERAMADAEVVARLLAWAAHVASSEVPMIN